MVHQKTNDAKTPKQINMLQDLPQSIIEKPSHFVNERVKHCGECPKSVLLRMTMGNDGVYAQYKCAACPNCFKSVTTKIQNEFFECPLEKFPAEAW